MVYEAIKAKAQTMRQLVRHFGLNKDTGFKVLVPHLSVLCDHTRKNPDGVLIGRKVGSEFVNCEGSHPFAIQESKYYACS